MRVIFISTDKKIYEPGSAVTRRFEDYKKLFDEVYIVVLNRNIFSAYKTAKSIIHNSKFIIQNLIISSQDPFETGIVGVLLKLKFGLPLQIQLHTDFNNKYFLLSTPLNFVRFFLAHLILPFADSVRVVSERVRSNIGELAQNVNVLPISQGEALKNLVPKASPWEKKEKITILTVARLEKEKDLETAIRVFAQILNKYPNTEFVIVGEGSERKNLEKLANDLELQEKVKFAGWQNNVVRFFENAHIYISTSLFEGYGMSLVEAASAKMSMVLSDAGIAGEIFRDGESAFICKPKDIVCFTSALEQLIKDENLRAQMGERAFSAVLAHVISKETYLDRFKELVINTVPKSDLGESSFARMCRFAVLIIERNRVLRFILAGGTSALSQIAVLYLLTDVFGIWYLYSSILSFVFALFLSFTLQKFWAFRDRGITGTHVQFAKYAVVIFFGLLINTTMMFLLVDMLHLWYILAQIITGAFIAVVNFFSYKKFIFNKSLPQDMVQ